MMKGQRLAEIDDIVSTVTGSEFPEIQKHSLLLFERYTEGNGVVYQPRVMTINTDGSLRRQYALDVQHHDSLHDAKTLTPGGDVVQKMDVAISPKRFGMRRNVIYTTAGLSLNNTYYSITGFQTVNSSGTEDTVSMTTPEEEARQWFWQSRSMWGNAAMTIKGMEDKDIFVLAHSGPMNQSGNLYLYFLGVDRNESGTVSSHHINVKGGDQFYGHKVRDYTESLTLCGVAITAGDFNGDGYKNEIAMIINDMGGVTANMFSVTCENGTDLTVTNTGYSVVYGEVQNYELKYSDQSSVAAVAGDFDGDGVQEAALITRANLNYRQDVTVMPDIRVQIYKHTSGGWISDGLDAYNDFMGTFKVTRADLNGDGEDELVFLVLHQVDWDINIYPRLEFWGFNKGSIKPVRVSGLNKGDDTSFLGFGLKGNEYSEYYKTAEDFSLTAGPLLGTRGHAKLAEDIAISHVNSEGSKVFIIPTLLNANRDFVGFGDAKKIYESGGTDSARRGGLITSDFANETLMLGKPSRTQDEHDESYIAVIQALPYHVDNVGTDGKLTSYPINYTFSGFGDNADNIKGEMSVRYTTTETSSAQKNVSFGLASTTETISILGKAGPYVQGYLKFRATEANIAGNFDPRIKAAAGAMNELLKLVTDRIDTTTTNANSSANSSSISTTLEAKQFDALITYTAPQYIWRYKILNKPIPSWYVLGPKADYVSKDFTSEAESQERYITFSMYDTATPSSTHSDRHYAYQARHEEGNFFSYPSLIEDIEGYTSGGDLASSPYSAVWDKSESGMLVSFDQTKINSQTYDEKIQKSALSKAISAIASFFGAKDPTGLPPYTSHSEAFVKRYSSKEAIDIKLYGRTSLPGEAAGHRLMAMPYTAREGTMKVGTAVALNEVGMEYGPALWYPGSRYNTYPDPALVLPYKYVMCGATLIANDQRIASQARGIRYYVPALDLDSDNSILGGFEYKIKIPLYNASFRDTGDFQVSLYYVEGGDFNISKPHEKADNLQHIQTITMSLKGWANGSRLNKGWAEFTWNVPENLSDGSYYFYVKIDPENKLEEVHESRLDANDKPIDVGGNNEGYYVFNYSSPGTIVNKNNRQASGSFKAAAHTGNGTILRTAYRSGNSEGGVGAAMTVYDTTGTVSVKAKIDGYDDIEILYLLERFAEIAATDSRDAIPVECELEYTGDEYYHEAYFYGVHYKPGALDAVGGDYSNISDDAVSEYFLVNKLPLVPGKTVKFMMSLHPDDIDSVNGSGFQLVVPELAVNVNSKDVTPSDPPTPTDPTTPTDPEEPEDNGEIGVSSTSGGCETGTGIFAAVILAGAVILGKMKRK